MEHIQQMLELLDRPAFCVEEGRIRCANKMAQLRQVPIGADAAQLLTSGKEAYGAFSGGYLCLRLRVSGEDYVAVVSDLGGKHIFTLEPDDLRSELRMLELAAMELREPLGAVMALVDELPEDMEPERLAQINRGLYQLLRIVGNMSGHPVPKFELMELNALLREIWDGAQAACEGRNVTFRFVPCQMPVYSCVDGELLTRAVHNLLSNALKFTPEGGRIEMKLTLDPQSYRITVFNDADLPEPIRDPFFRYRRMPGIEDGRCGLGLGLTLVRSAAVAHGGSALVTQPGTGGLLVALTLPRRQDTIGLRFTRHPISYSGDRSPILIELSEVLPPEFYKK